MLRICSALIVASGVGLAAAAVAGDLLAPLFAAVFGDRASDTYGPYSQLGMAVAGGLTAGYGVAIYRTLTAEQPTRASVARGLMAGALTWFAVDSIASVVLGAWGNVAGNAVFLTVLLAALVPLARAAEPAPAAPRGARVGT